MKHSLSFVWIFLVIAVSGCSMISSTSDSKNTATATMPNDGGISVRIKCSFINPANVSAAKAIVCGPDINDVTNVLDVNYTNNTISGSVTGIPVGKNRILTVNIYGQDDRITASGSVSNLVIVSGQVNTANIVIYVLDNSASYSSLTVNGWITNTNGSGTYTGSPNGIIVFNGTTNALAISNGGFSFAFSNLTAMTNKPMTLILFNSDNEVIGYSYNPGINIEAGKDVYVNSFIYIDTGSIVIEGIITNTNLSGSGISLGKNDVVLISNIVTYNGGSGSIEDMMYYSEGNINFNGQSSFFQCPDGDIIMSYPMTTELRIARKTGNTWSYSAASGDLYSADEAIFAADNNGKVYMLYITRGHDPYYYTYYNAYLYLYNNSSQHWDYLVTLLSNQQSEANGPADITKGLIADANGNIHIFYQREGWFSYGYYLSERVYNVSDNSLSPLTFVSSRNSGYNPDTIRNFFISAQLTSNGKLSVLCFDQNIGSTGGIFIMANSSPYTNWYQDGSDSALDCNYMMSHKIDASGNSHYLYLSANCKSLYYRENSLNNPETIAETTLYIQCPTLLVTANGDIYACWVQYEITNGIQQIKIYAKAKRNGIWTDRILISDQAGYLAHPNGWNYFGYNPVFLSSGIDKTVSKVYLKYLMLDGNTCQEHTAYRKYKIIELFVN